MRRPITFIIICIMYATAAYCQLNPVDPGRAAEALLLSKSQKNSLEKEVAAQGMETTGHVLESEEVKKKTDFQKQFNAYLDSMRNILSIAAEMYGIYYEVSQTTHILNQLEEVLADSPENVLALAVSSRRSSIYGSLYKQCIGIMKDIQKACFSETKMTEKERMNIIGKVKPKLRNFNRQIKKLTLALRYTTFVDIWGELSQRGRHMIGPDRKNAIARRRGEDWLENAKTVVVH